MSLSVLAEDIRLIVYYNQVFGFILLIPIGLLVSIFSLAMKFDLPFFDKLTITENTIYASPTQKNWKYFIWNLSLRMMEFVLAGIITTLFLGGSYLPIPTPDSYIAQIIVFTLNFMFKCIIVLLITTIIKSILPRLKLNQKINICWKILTPISMLSLLIIGVYLGLEGLIWGFQ